MVASHSPPSLLTSSAVFAAIAACASAVYTFSPPPHAVFLTCTSSVLAILALLTADPPMFLAILLVNPVTRVIVPRALVDYTRRHDLALAVAVEGMRERDRAATEAASAAAAAEAAQTQLASFGAFPSEDDASPGAASTRVPTGEVPVRMVLREVARRMCWRFMVPCTLASMALQVITLLKPKYIGDVFDKIVRSDATMDSVRILHQSQPSISIGLMARFSFRELLAFPGGLLSTQFVLPTCMLWVRTRVLRCRLAPLIRLLNRSTHRRSTGHTSAPSCGLFSASTFS